jgi:hypothetical protein
MTGLAVCGPGRLTGVRRRPIGRHRQGRPLIRPKRREWDSAEKARAAQLDLLEPGWLVLYGLYYRRFYAIARVRATAEPLVCRQAVHPAGSSGSWWPPVRTRCGRVTALFRP